MRFLTIVFLLLTFVSSSQSDTIIFSHSSGYYSTPFTLKISNNSHRTIYYSVDGNYPNRLFKDSMLVSSTLTLRVKNEGESKDYIRNFLFTKHQLPVVFLTLKPADLFDSISGMYVKGPGAKPEPPYHGANFHKNWERIANIELLDTNNTSSLNQKVGIRIFGQYSAMLPQKSFSIHAKGKYGKKKIKSRVFPDLELKKYKSLILRNSGSDFCNSHFRDVLMTGLVRNWNIETQASRSCVVYLNGNYWGIYHLREKLNEHYLQQHFDVDKDSVAILKHKRDVQHYGRLNYTSMVKFIEKTDFSLNENIDSLSKLMDIDNYLDYNIAQLYCNNIDAGGNIRYWRSIKPGSVWRWMLFDTDFGFGLSKSNGYKENTVEDYFVKSNRRWPYPAWSTLIIRKLMENEEVKQNYTKKITNYLNDELSEETVNKEIERLKSLLQSEISTHFERWHRPIKTWNNSLNRLTEFAEHRPSFLRKHLVDFFGLDSIYSVSIGVMKNGTCRLNDVTHSSPWKGKFFSNTSYSITAEPGYGYHFLHWKEDTTNRLSTFLFGLDADRCFTPVFEKNPPSDFNGKVIFNEIGKKDSIHGSYIELQNLTDKIINVSGWRLMNQNGLYFVIPEGSMLTSKGFFTVYQRNGPSERLNSLFKIKSNDTLLLYSNTEEGIDTLDLSQNKFKKMQALEWVDAAIRKGWFAVKEGTPNETNRKQKQSEEENKYIWIGFVVGIVLLFLFVLFYKRTNRLRGATE